MALTVKTEFSALHQLEQSSFVGRDLYGRAFPDTLQRSSSALKNRASRSPLLRGILHPDKEEKKH